MPELLLALDVGTTSTRALLSTPDGRVAATARRGIASVFPRPGAAEQDAEAVWTLTLAALQEALIAAGRTMSDVAAVGVTCQRASVVVWDRSSGEPVAPMVLWSDLRGIPRFHTLREAGFQAWPQTPACKLESILDAAPDGRSRAERGELLWGTLDSFLTWRLSGGLHVTDTSNAWLSGYLDPAAPLCWNGALLAHQGLLEAMFPTIVDTWGPIGRTAPLFGGSPLIGAIIADQQAGILAHNALSAGAWKASFGTSAVVMVCSGDTLSSPHRTMPAEALAMHDGRWLFGFEAMVISAGSFIDWLCGRAGLFDSAKALEALAAEVQSANGAAMRPSLQGLGAPHGRFDARGVIAGLSPGVGKPELARAALEGIAFRVREAAQAVVSSTNLPVPEELPVDGGGAGADALMQIQADLLSRPVRRHAVREATALGAALAAGLGAGVIVESDLREAARYDRTFMPRITRDEADLAYATWVEALSV